MFFLVILQTFFAFVRSLRYDSGYLGWNLNENATASSPLDYWGQWDNHTFHPSPANWRFPFYVVTIDRFVDGDPTNNEANETNFEHDWMSNQFRFGGDAKGLMNNLDYIQGMGIKVSTILIHSTASPLHTFIVLQCKALLTAITRHSIFRAARSSTCPGEPMASGLWTLRSSTNTMARSKTGGI
jgi:hypothetical protein